MKLTYFTFLIFIYGSVLAQEKITEADLQNYINKKVEYCDKVYGTFVTKGESQVILLNLGDSYPNHKLVVAIFQSDWGNFDYKPNEFLDGKTICVKGKLVLYKGKPEIIVKSQKQITVN